MEWKAIKIKRKILTKSSAKMKMMCGRCSSFDVRADATKNAKIHATNNFLPMKNVSQSIIVAGI